MEQYLLHHALLNKGRGFLPAAYSPTRPGYILNLPNPNAEAGRCWDNVLDAQASGQGDPVFGWAFWPLNFTNYGIYLAQYHAVIADPNGDLIDVTPQLDLYPGNKILFMADPRVGFDYQSSPLRQPAMLEYTLAAPLGSPNPFSWLAIDEKMNHVVLKVPSGAVDGYHLLTMEKR